MSIKDRLKSFFSLTKKKNKTKQHLSKPQNKEKEIEKELKIIYQEDGKLPNMTKLEISNSHRLKNLVILIIVTLFLIFIATLLGFFVFRSEPKFTGKKVNVEIKAPFSAVSAERITYQLKIINNEAVSLTNNQLIVYLPYNFVMESSNLPAVIKDNEKIDNKAYSNIKTWQLTDLIPSQAQNLDITGRLIGFKNSKHTISATLSYIPANFNSEFQKNVSFTTEINDTFIDYNAEYAPQVANLEESEFNLKITNRSQDFDLNNLQVELNLPPEFVLSESQIITENAKDNPIVKENPKEPISQKIWTIDKLAPLEEKNIKFKGKFDVQESKTLDLNLLVKQKGPAEEYISQREEKITVDVVKGELLTNLILNGSSQNQPVNFNDTLNYLLVLKNKSKKPIGDLKVRAVLDSPLLDWKSLNDKNQGLIEENQILWTKDQVALLDILLPEEEVEINFQINLTGLQQSKKYKEEELKVKSFFEVQINKLDNKDAEIVVQSNSLINELNTDLNLTSSGRYFADDNSTIGSGPLPPIVGQKTSYKIFWTITNSLHEISNIKVKTKLPDYVTFEGLPNVSAGDLNKNEQNEIIWQISRIPTSVKESTAEFTISITPQSGDINKILTLIPEVVIEATDFQTKGTLSKTISGLTTNLDSDPLGKGKGLIQGE